MVQSHNYQHFDASTYDVQYDDGEVDEDLCWMCIWLYGPLQVDEEVEVREEEEDIFYYSGRVVKVHADGTVDIDRGTDGFFEKVDVGHTHRSDPEPELVVGSYVQALYQGGKIWYDGVIGNVHTDGMYDVLYDDGDHEFHVNRKFIRVV